MPLDGITTHFLAKELKDTLTGGRVDKVYQPTRYDILLSIRQSGQTLRLLLSANPSCPRLHLTTITRENPALPPQFCMFLRKHIGGSRIIGITSPGFERIVEFEMETTDEIGDLKRKFLIIELMGRHSNIILLNAERRILDSLLHVDAKISRVREVMPARPYVYPPAQDKISPAQALEACNNNKIPIIAAAANRPLEKALQESLLGFSPLLAREICYLSQLDPRMGIAQISDPQQIQLLQGLSSVLQKITEGEASPSAYSITPQEAPKDFHALFLKDAGYQTACESISQAMDMVYGLQDTAANFQQKKRHLLQFCQNALSHALRKQNIHQQDIESCAERFDLQKFGQLLLANAYQIPAGASNFRAQDYESTDESYIDIPLNQQKSIAQNAQEYFKRATKMKAKFEASSRFLEEDEQAVAYLSSLCQGLEMAQDEEDLEALREEMLQSGLLSSSSADKASKKKNQPIQNLHPGKSKSGSSSSRALRAAAKAAQDKTKRNNSKVAKPISSATAFRRYISSEGYEILCGRNNIQNDQLTLKIAAAEDLWFHVQKMPGTHVILRCAHKQATDQAILEAAQIAAYFSRPAGRPQAGQAESGSSSLKLPVDYCPAKQVRKPRGSKPGMVIYDHYNTVLVAPQLP